MKNLSRAAIQPSEAAVELTGRMLEQRGVMQEILAETVPDSEDARVHESGRTFCSPGSVQGPLARFPSSIELASCPRGVNGGTWHTHVTKAELREPHNSLPDAANVLFGSIDTSIVVGTRSAEAFMAPEDREAAIAAFQDALGAEVTSTEEVVDAILDGEISSPTDARRRVRRRLSPLFRRVNTGFTEMDQVIEASGIPASSPASVEVVEAQFYSQLGKKDKPIEPSLSACSKKTATGLKNYSNRGTNVVKRALTRSDVSSVARNAAVSEVVRKTVRSVL